ncbi:MAG: M48 family metallopeptidase [Desulfobacteraceae bacterium]|nr:M48 family metallopeptidase [Desulfobacteraceae bacterium]MCF8111862.1 M48 family metallopeptidase [Desulfobacteraceae bacterium]
MSRFAATLFDGKSSAARTVNVEQDGKTLRICGRDGDFIRSAPLGGCRITPPLGNTRRTIYLPDGARLDIDDQDAVAGLELYDTKHPGMKLVHSLESKWGLVVFSLAGLVFCVWLFIAYGIPFLADKAARSVPAAMTETVSDRAFSQLDKRFLEKTELPKSRIAEIRAYFEDIAGDMKGDLHFRLLFRKSPQIGANALALPSGKVLVTDDLVKMAESRKEFAGIFAHEMAHVQERHGLRMVFQNAGVFFVVSALFGDVVSATSLGAALPTMLLERGYSKQFERQADLAAGKYLIRRMGSTKLYRRILQRLAEKSGGNSAPSIISTHPNVKNRILRLKTLEKTRK